MKQLNILISTEKEHVQLEKIYQADIWLVKSAGRTWSFKKHRYLDINSTPDIAAEELAQALEF